jgi:hypothetical protein
MRLLLLLGGVLALVGVLGLSLALYAWIVRLLHPPR